MTKKTAFQLIVDVTGQLRLSRNEHLKIQEALDVINRELDNEKDKE